MSKSASMRFSSFVRFDFWSLWSFLSLYRLVFLYICSIRLGITRCAKITTAYSTQHYRPICLETFQSLDKQFCMYSCETEWALYTMYIWFYFISWMSHSVFCFLIYCIVCQLFNCFQLVSQIPYTNGVRTFVYTKVLFISHQVWTFSNCYSYSEYNCM